ncbi:aminoglycoside phosphotransferase/kinase family protein [Niabella ginsengisoli]|uniref:Aminoglycoside phosphotransferase family protein n=1 Tax=Niabella ginsengisoli TaxID=522298 RepID=A0ABS9SKI0_9BACT|nr:hypothetical protein [Niabella ginsengisoli]MCH5598888.1 hypothetical protein [Niabella ginsengisoli]
MHNVLAHYGFEKSSYTVEKFGSGLINDTCLVKNGKGKYILQRVNDKVFVDPFLIADNIEKIEAYLAETKSDYFFTTPHYTLKGESMVKTEDGFYRVFPFVKDSHTIDVVQTPEQAFEAASSLVSLLKYYRGLI